MADYIKYANQGATRRQPLNPRLAEALGFLPQMGVSAEVFSGGQPSAAEGGPRTGSVRHDHGGAADVFFHKDGRRLDWANPQDTPIFQDIVRRGRAAGLTGFGAGPGYMQPGSMHVGFGAPGVWGAGGSGKNAPSWLTEAFGGAPAGPAAQPAGLGDMLNPTPTAQQNGPMQAPDMADPRGVQTTVEPGVGLDALASMFQPQPQTMSQQVKAREDERAAEDQRRRTALFSGSPFGPFGPG